MKKYFIYLPLLIVGLLSFSCTDNDDTVLMSLTGDFDLNEISTLTNKMNIPGGDVLKKASKSSK